MSANGDYTVKAMTWNMGSLRGRGQEISGNTLNKVAVDAIKEANIDIINLQQVPQNETDSQNNNAFIKRLKGEGYTVVRGSTTEYAIAFNSTRFTKIGKEQIVSTKEKTPRHIGMYVDLKDNNTGKIIRSVTSHLIGCDLQKIQKWQTAKQGATTEEINERSRKIKAEIRKGQTDADSVKKMDPRGEMTTLLAKTSKTSLMHRIQGLKPSLIIQGMDANRTPKYYSKEIVAGKFVQTKLPKELRIDADTTKALQEQGYTAEDTFAATMRDLKLKKDIKTDILVAKSLDGRCTTKNETIPTLNNPNLLNETSSKHLPVINTITLTKTTPNSQTFLQKLWDSWFNPPPKDLAQRIPIEINMKILPSAFKKELQKIGVYFKSGGDAYLPSGWRAEKDSNLCNINLKTAPFNAI
ncbi:MAG: hypothetical protein V4489_07860 [Chlamydiota bacterium]